MTSLIIGVYRNGTQDCTNGGVSADVNSLTIVGTCSGDDNIVRPLDTGYRFPSIAPSPTAPAVALAHRVIAGRRIAEIVPVKRNDDGSYTAKRGGMSGGNFGFSFDSRFARVLEDLSGSNRFDVPLSAPVSIMDRFE